MSDSVRPHRQQPTRLPRPWDSPGKNTGVGCYFLLQCMKVKSERSCSVVSDSLQLHGPQPTRLLHPWGFSREEYWSGVPLPSLVMLESSDKMWSTAEGNGRPLQYSCIGAGNSNPLQCSCLENPGDGEAWWAAVYGVIQSRTRLTQLSNSSIQF